jgi:integrase
MRLIHRCQKCRKFLPVNKSCCVKEKTYYLEYRINGKLKREKIGNDLKIANVVLGDRQRQELLGKHVGRPAEVSLVKLIEWYLELEEVKNLVTFRQTRNILLNLNTEIGQNLCDIRANFQKYLSGRTGTPATKNRDISAFKSLFSTALNYDKIDKNPIAAFKLLEVNNVRTVILCDSDIDLLFAVCDRRIADIVLFASMHLMRWNEIITTEWADIRDNLITVRTRKKGSAKVRQCPLDPEGWKLISSYPSRFQKGRVFEQIPYSTFNRLFEKAKEKAGLTDIHFHDLRHYAADRMQRKGYGTADIMRWAGWKSMSIFHRYTTSKAI